MLEIVIATGLGAVLARLAWIDLAEHRLPDAWTLPLILAGLALSLAGLGPEPLDAAIGGAAGYAVFWAIGTLFFLRRGIDGLGLGDAKLFAAAGAWLGYALLPQVLLVACLGGLGHALVVRRGAGEPLAFGPWLALGFWLVWSAQAAGLRVAAF